MSGLIAALEPFLPHLGVEVQALVRIAYGLVLLGTLAGTLPHRRFFLSGRWGGFSRSTRLTDAVQNPVVYPAVMAAWICSALLIVTGRWSPWPALINLILARYFFVHMRWSSVGRGMGAPGFLIYWLGAVLFLLELTLHHAPELRGLALLVAQIDLAFILASAGLYKLTAGYAHGAGMEFGLANPAWGRWWKSYAALPPTHWVFRTLNHLAWSTELLIAVLAVIPQTRLWAGALLIVSFAWIATQLRLSLLCESVIVAGLLFVGPETSIAQSVAFAIPAAWLSSPTTVTIPASVNGVLALSLLGYLLLLPFAYGGLLFNFYGRRALPKSFQLALERYTNFFGLIIWRVFSADHTDFFVLVHERPRRGGTDRLLSRFPGLTSPVPHPSSLVSRPSSLEARYRHVAESITLTTLFTTRKYYPSNRPLFIERLLRYTRTVPCSAGAILIFTYVQLRKDPDCFRQAPLAEYIVDPVSGAVQERVLETDVDTRFLRIASPVFEATAPGTYVPAAVAES